MNIDQNTRAVVNELRTTRAEMVRILGARAISTAERIVCVVLALVVLSIAILASSSALKPLSLPTPESTDYAAGIYFLLIAIPLWFAGIGILLRGLNAGR